MDVFERLENGGTPRTAWEIAYASVTAPGRGALRNEEDLSALGLSVIELANAVANAIAIREGIQDAHAKLTDAAVRRIHSLGRLPPSTRELRKTAGKFRIAELERRAIALVHDSNPNIDATKAVRSVDKNLRRDKARGVTKTLDELAGDLAALALAAIDREAHTNDEPLPLDASRDSEEAYVASKAFYRAIGGAVEPESVVGIAKIVVDGFRPLEASMCQHKELRDQLADTRYAGGEVSHRLAADLAFRDRYPFGLRNQESRAYLAAAIHLLFAQAGRTNLARASSELQSKGEPGEKAAREAVLAAVAESSKLRNARRHTQEYQPMPNRFDSLRALAIAQLLPSEDQVPRILGVNRGSDEADRLLLHVFPLVDGTDMPWTTASWTTAGERVQDKLNFKHKILSVLPAFSMRDFEASAASAFLAGLEDFIKILIRAEGRDAGYSNGRRTSYEHHSAVSLSNTAATRLLGWSFTSVFNELEAEITKGSRPRNKNAKGPSQYDTIDEGSALQSSGWEIPDALVILSRPELLSLLVEVASLTPSGNDLSPEARRLITPDPTKRTEPEESARMRDAAIACIQFVHWIHGSDDPDFTLENAFAEFYKEMSNLGQAPFNLHDVAELLNDTLVLLPDVSSGKGTA